MLYPLILSACLLAPQDPGRLHGTSQHPLASDATGLKWVLPFKAARAGAASRKRLLMIKPVAFGTTPDGGW